MPLDADVVKDIFKAAGKDTDTPLAQALMKEMEKEGSVAAAHAILEGNKDILKDAFKHQAAELGKSGLRAGRDLGKGVFSWKGITTAAGTAVTVGGYYIIGKGILGAHNAQDSETCHDKCLTGNNTDQTPYAIDSKTPDPNCPAGTTDCESYCSVDDPGACSTKNNLARGEAQCSGLGMAECVENAVGGAFDSWENFWGTFGTSITYLGYGLAVFLLCIFVYYTVKSFAVTRVGNVVGKAKSAGESFGRKKIPATGKEP